MKVSMSGQLERFQPEVLSRQVVLALSMAISPSFAHQVKQFSVSQQRTHQLTAPPVITANAQLPTISSTRLILTPFCLKASHHGLSETATPLAITALLDGLWSVQYVTSSIEGQVIIKAKNDTTNIANGTIVTTMPANARPKSYGSNSTN